MEKAPLPWNCHSDLRTAFRNQYVVLSLPLRSGLIVPDVIGYYQTVMYDALGITGHRNTLVAGIYNIVGPIANLIFIVFILDRVGRRKPLLFGAAGITIALACEAALGSQNPDGTKTSMSTAGVFFLFLVSGQFMKSFCHSIPADYFYSHLLPLLWSNQLGIHGRDHANANSR